MRNSIKPKKGEYESLAAGAQGPYFTHRRRSRRLGRKETPCSADSGTGKKQSLDETLSARDEIKYYDY